MFYQTKTTSSSCEKYDYVKYETRLDIIKSLLEKNNLPSINLDRVEKDLENMYDSAIDYLEECRNDLEKLMEAENYKQTPESEELEEEIYDAEKIVKQISKLLDHF